MVSQGETNEETKEKDPKQSHIQWKQKAMLREMHDMSRSTMDNIQKTKSTRRSQRRRIDRRKRDLEQKKVENIDGRHWMLLDRHVYGGVGVLNENIGALSLRFIRYTFGIGHMKHQKGRVFALDFYGLWQSQGKAPLVLLQKEDKSAVLLTVVLVFIWT
eukprot:1169263_1